MQHSSAGGLHIYNVEISLIHCPLTPTARTKCGENPNVFPPSRDYTLVVFLPCLSAPPPRPLLLENSFSAQTSVGKGESLISQGLSFKFHYWDWMQIWVTADAAMFLYIYIYIYTHKKSDGLCDNFTWLFSTQPAVNRRHYFFVCVCLKAVHL